MTEIPFSKPYFSQAEADIAGRVILSGAVGGAGPITARVQKQMEARFGVRHALLVTSGTHAMELALMASNLEPGDEVILPSFTFTSTATAVLRQGARPVFAEIDEDTFNLDVEDVAARITPRTRAIIPVHYAGVAARMDRIMEMARTHDLFV